MTKFIPSSTLCEVWVCVFSMMQILHTPCEYLPHMYVYVTFPGKDNEMFPLSCITVVPSTERQGTMS